MGMGCMSNHAKACFQHDFKELLEPVFCKKLKTEFLRGFLLKLEVYFQTFLKIISFSHVMTQNTYSTKTWSK